MCVYVCVCVCACMPTCRSMLRIHYEMVTTRTPPTSHTHTHTHNPPTLTPHSHMNHQLILCREYTRAEDQDWHINHFCCLRCDVGLGGKQYRPQDGQPFCLTCYEISFSTVCEVREWIVAILCCKGG